MNVDVKLLISIILPIYNGEKFMAQSIESCLSQTYKNIELIIVNDCSTDDSLKIARKYQNNDNRIKIIDNSINKKLPASLNIGHRAAKGFFITWTSDDNWYEVNAIEKLHTYIMAHDCDVAYSNVKIVNANGIFERKHYYPNNASILFGNVIGSCFLYKKEVYDSVGGYNESLFLLEDYDFWLQSIVNFRFKKIDLFLYNYRKHPQSLTAKISAVEETNKLFSKNMTTVFENFYGRTKIANTQFMVNLSLAEINYRRKNYKWHKQNFTAIRQTFDIISNHCSLRRNDLKKLHLQKIINSSDFKENFCVGKIIFILYHFTLQIRQNDIKTLVKYAIKF